MVCQDTADSLDNRSRIDAIIIDSLKAFDLVPHDWLLMKIASSGVVWIREFLLGHTQRITVGGQLSEEVRVTSRVQGSFLGLLLFLSYINDIWRNNESTIKLFTDDYIYNIKENFK
jgi:hypothetical protein